MTEYEIYKVVYLAAYSLCVISFIASIVVFFRLKIYKVIGDLTGRNAKKAIQGINAQNENAKNAESGKVQRLSPRQITDRISESGKIVRKDNYSPLSATEKIATAKIIQAADVVVPQSGEVTTTLPIGVPAGFVAGETTTLGVEQTTILNADQTTILNDNYPVDCANIETTPDSEDEKVLSVEKSENNQNMGETTLLGNFFVIEEDITYVNSDTLA